MILASCGGGTFDSSEVNEGSVIGQRQATLREDRSPVTGTVVTRSGDQVVLEVEYEDGFPNGRTREWYPDGTSKLERVVKYVDHGQMGGGLRTVGDHKAWCENGTDLGPMIDALIQAGAGPDAQTHQGLTAAMLALQAGMYDVAGALLEKSDAPAATDKQGLNVVHHAFLVPGLNQVRLDLPDDRRAFIELAVKEGVDPVSPLGGGGSLVTIAEQNGAIELAQYLRQLKP